MTVLTSLYDCQMILCLVGFFCLFVYFICLTAFTLSVSVLSSLYLSIVQNVPIRPCIKCSMHLIIWLSTSKHSFLTALNLLHSCHHWLEHVLLPPAVVFPHLPFLRLVCARLSSHSISFCSLVPSAEECPDHMHSYHLPVSTNFNAFFHSSQFKCTHLKEMLNKVTETVHLCCIHF